MRIGLVVGDTFGDGGGSDIESSGDSGGAGHVRDGGLAGEESGDGEIFVAKAEIGFGAFAIELRELDAHVGIGGGAIGEGLGLAAKTGEVGVVSIVTIEHDDFGVHTEELGLGGEISAHLGVVLSGGDEIGESGSIDRQTIENFGAKSGGRSGNDGVSNFGFPGVVKKLVKHGGFNHMVGSENGSWLAGGTQDFVNIVGNGGLAVSAGNTDKT